MLIMNTEIERGQERLIHTYQVHSQEPYAVFLSKPMGLFPKQLNWKHHGKDECLPSQRHYDKKRKKNKMIQDKRKKTICCISKAFNTALTVFTLMLA